MPSRIIRGMFVRLAAVIPAFPLVLLMFSASSCYDPWPSFAGTGGGNHVFLVKMQAECVDYGYSGTEPLSDRPSSDRTLHAEDLNFLPYSVYDGEWEAQVKKYETLRQRGFYDNGNGTVSYALRPGTLFRVTHSWSDVFTGEDIYAEVLNGALAGKQIEISMLGFEYRYFEERIPYPAGKTRPCWLNISEKPPLDTDLLEDLGELSNEELREKGLWMEPGLESTRKAVMKQLPEGVDLHQLEIDAERHDVEAMILLGNLYYEGAGVRRDRSLAEYLFRDAAEKGGRDAEFRLALAYSETHRGWRSGEAEKIFRKYAEQGDADAQFCLGLLLEYGYERVKYVLPVDEEELEKWKESVVWYRKAADQGDARAMRALGMAYCEPDDSAFFWSRVVRVEEDYEMAAEWFKKAAELGDFAAQRNLGYLYLKGKGVEKDNAEARKWLEKAAAQGDIYASDLLKEMN